MEDRIEEKAEQERFNITTQNQNRSVEDLKIIIKDLGVRGIHIDTLVNARQKYKTFH